MSAAPASPFECVLDIGASLGEGPVWSAHEQALYWVDINAPSLNRFEPATRHNVVMPMPCSIGCVALRERGGFVLALRDGMWLASPDGRLERKVSPAPYDPHHHRYNDGRVDPQGRFWAGFMNEQQDGATAALVRIDPDFHLTRVLEGMTISNGLAFVPDATRMYHADTPTRTIRVFDFDGRTGTPSNPRVFARFTAAGDRPDGAAVDSAGCYWSAFYDAGKVVRLSPAGELLAEYAVPAMAPTMVAFGGPDLRTVFVTSARQKRPADELARYPRSGGIFAMRVDVPGQPEPAFAG